MHCSVSKLLIWSSNSVKLQDFRLLLIIIIHVNRLQCLKYKRRFNHARKYSIVSGTSFNLLSRLRNIYFKYIFKIFRFTRQSVKMKIFHLSNFDLPFKTISFKFHSIWHLKFFFSDIAWLEANVTVAVVDWRHYVSHVNWRNDIGEASLSLDRRDAARFPATVATVIRHLNA